MRSPTFGPFAAVLLLQISAQSGLAAMFNYTCILAAGALANETRRDTVLHNDDLVSHNARLLYECTGFVQLIHAISLTSLHGCVSGQRRDSLYSQKKRNIGEYSATSQGNARVGERTVKIARLGMRG